MVRFVTWLLIAASTAHAQSAASARFLDAAAREQLEQARAAVLGGRSSDVSSLLLRGRLRVGISRDEAIDGLVEIRVLLPDRYVRLDTVNGTERRSGFSGATLLTPKGTLTAERAAFTRLMLGLAAYVPADPRLTFQSTGESAFADTVAIDVTGPAFVARMVFDSPSRVPLRLVYDSRHGAGTVMSFANRRDVDGLALPSRITTLIADRVLETLMFDEMRVNAGVRDADFRR